MLFKELLCEEAEETNECDIEVFVIGFCNVTSSNVFSAIRMSWRSLMEM